MLILLPPSETKRVGGSGTLRHSSLRASRRLGATRTRVRKALMSLSKDPAAAAKPLKLGAKNQEELQHNLRLLRSGVLPAIERYTGVLYDYLDVETMAPAARLWIDEHVLIQSALFGLISAADEIPAYRLSASSRVPDLEAPLKRVWQRAHALEPWPEDRLILDLRSQDYAALAPLPAERGHTLQVVHRGADGEVRALNHFNKAAKGDLVRRFAQSQANLATVSDLIDLGARAGVELVAAEQGSDITLVTSLGAPQV